MGILFWRAARQRQADSRLVLRLDGCCGRDLRDRGACVSRGRRGERSPGLPAAGRRRRRSSCSPRGVGHWSSSPRCAGGGAQRDATRRSTSRTVRPRVSLSHSSRTSPSRTRFSASGTQMKSGCRPRGCGRCWPIWPSASTHRVLVPSPHARATRSAIDRGSAASGASPRHRRRCSGRAVGRRSSAVPARRVSMPCDRRAG